MPEAKSGSAAAAAAAAVATAAATAAAVAAAVELLKADLRLNEIEKRLVGLEQAIGQAQKTLGNIETAANRWKGGFLVVVSLGAIIGWLVSIGGSIKGMLK